jgi:hypothetical protein
MRLRRAVPKIHPKSSVSPTLPFHKSRSPRTRSESTLPQLLIPLDFKSFRSNIYKKWGEGVPPPSPKVLQLVTPQSPVLHTHSNARNSFQFMGLLHGSLDTRGGGYPLRKRATLSTPCLSHVANGSPSVVSVLFLPPITRRQSLHPPRSSCSQGCRPILRAGWLKQFPGTPRLLCKNRSLNAPDTIPGGPRLSRGAL